MAKQIVANNGELPPSVALSVAVKPIPNVGAKNIRSLPRGVGACASQRARGSASAKQSTGAEYDGVSGVLNVQLIFMPFFFPSTLGLAATARGGVLTTSCWTARSSQSGVPRQPVYISVLAFQDLFRAHVHFMPIQGANYGSGVEKQSY